MLNDWTHWLSSLCPDELLTFLWGLLLVDGLRYTFGKVLMVFWDFGRESWWAARGKPLAENFDYCPSVCVILAGYNEGEIIESTLRSTWGTYPRLEIVVVDDGSLDDMAAKAQAFANDHAGVLVLKRPRRGGKSSAMNLALQYTKAEVIVVIDADSDVGELALWRIVQPLSDPRVGAVGGAVLGRNLFTNLATWMQGYEYLSSIFVGRLLSYRMGILGIVSGAWGAFRREALDRAQGWDVGPPEDLDLTMTIRKGGYRVGFTPFATCYTDLPATWKSLFRQRVRWDQSGVIRVHCRKHLEMACFWRPGHYFSDAALIFEAIFTNIICLTAIWGWIFWFCFNSSFDSWKLFLTLYLSYLVLETFQCLTILYYSENLRRDALVCLVWPLVPLYQLFLMVTRTYAQLREALFKLSYQDNYVPKHVREATWQW